MDTRTFCWSHWFQLILKLPDDQRNPGHKASGRKKIKCVGVRVCLWGVVQTLKIVLRPAGSDPEVVCQKDSFLKVSVSLGGFGPSVAHGKHSVRRRCVQATKKQGRNLLSP